MAKKQMPPLSPSETEILRILWEMEVATVQEVWGKLPIARNVSYSTVQTLFRRLEKKGYVTHKRKSKAYVYTPAVKRDDVIGSAVKSFLDKLFGGDPVPLMQYLAGHNGVDAEDIERLKELIEDKEK